jgi:hypothetical protein
MRDEYNQGSILFSSPDLDKVLERVKREINAVNVDNALTVADKKRNWESFMVQVETEIKLADVADEVTLRMFCGTLDGEDWFASVPSRTVRGEEDEVDSLTHPALQGKNVYFIKPV